MTRSDSDLNSVHNEFASFQRHGSSPGKGYDACCRSSLASPFPDCWSLRQNWRLQVGLNLEFVSRNDYLIMVINSYPAFRAWSENSSGTIPCWRVNRHKPSSLCTMPAIRSRKVNGNSLKNS